MKKLSILLLVFLAGCAADPAKLKSVAVEESGRLAKPSRPFSAFSSYELKPFVLSSGIKSEADKIQQAAVLEEMMQEKLLPLFANWASLGGSGRSGTLIVQPELKKLKIVSGGARFWVGAFAGQSSVDIDLRLIDGSTNKLIAKPRIKKNADAMTGAWSVGKSDRNLHNYIAHIAYEYFSANY